MILIKCFFLFNVVCISLAGWTIKLTPRNLEEQFKSKCKQFGDLRRTKIIYKPNAFDEASCNSLWETFRAASTEKDPCDFKPSDYADFMKQANALIKTDSIFKDQVSSVSYVRLIFAWIKFQLLRHKPNTVKLAFESLVFILFYTAIMKSVLKKNIQSAIVTIYCLILQGF